jgi:hypothetical protein
LFVRGRRRGERVGVSASVVEKGDCCDDVHSRTVTVHLDLDLYLCENNTFYVIPGQKLTKL